MMKQVLRIAIKDFQIQLRSILYYLFAGLVLIVMFSIIGLTQKQMVYSVAVFAILYGFVNKALYEDEKNNTLRLLASMPVKRDIIVYARYLSTFVLIIVLYISIWSFSMISDILTIEHTDNVTFIMVVSLFMLFTVMLSIYLPLAFKLGYIKAAGINRFVFLGLFALIGGVISVLAGVLENKQDSGISRKLAALDVTLSSMNIMVIFGCIILFALIVYLISMRISIKFFKKRELF
jgi:ABC-2 type transport system permease protein